MFRERRILGRLGLGVIGIGAVSFCLVCQTSGPGLAVPDGGDGGNERAQALDSIEGVGAGGMDAVDTQPDGMAGSGAAGTGSDPPARVPVNVVHACGGSGTLPQQTPATVCTTWPVLPYDGIDVQGEVVGALPGCEAIDPRPPGFRLDATIQVADPPLDAHDGTFDTAYHVVGNDGKADCGARIDIRSVSLTPALVKGDKFSISRYLIQGPNGDFDNAVTTVISDPTGKVVLAIISGVATPDRVAFNLLNGLTLRVAGTDLCTISDRHMLRIELAAADQKCALDSMTEACCNLWGGNYQARLQDAFTSPKPSPFVNLELARDGFWQAPPSR